MNESILAAIRTKAQNVYHPDEPSAEEKLEAYTSGYKDAIEMMLKFDRWKNKHYYWVEKLGVYHFIGDIVDTPYTYWDLLLKFLDIESRRKPVSSTPPVEKGANGYYQHCLRCNRITHHNDSGCTEHF